MRRREVITLLGGTVVLWPLAAHAQQPTRIPHVGALMNIAENDPQSRVWAAAFERGLEDRGWKPGNTLRIAYRWANNDSLYKRYAQELAKLGPDVILAVGGSSASALQEVTGTVPIVFMGTSDPVNRRLVASMEKPGGNITGFVEFESGIGAKWLELLKQIAPHVTRVAVVQDPMRSTWTSLRIGIEKAAPSFNMEVFLVDARDSAELERALATFAASPGGGLVVTPNLPEAAVLSGMPVGSPAEAREAARRIRALGPSAVLVKGGHGEGDEVVDLLFDGEQFVTARVHAAVLRCPSARNRACRSAWSITSSLTAWSARSIRSNSTNNSS